MGSGEYRFNPVEVVEKIQQGDREAEAALFKHYSRTLYFIVRNKSQDEELAKDITQDALLTVINHCKEDKIREPKALTQYLRSTALNMLTGHFRKEQRRSTDLASDTMEEIPSVDSSSYQALYTKQKLELVLQVVDELKMSRDRELIHAYFFRFEDKQSLCDRFELKPAHFDRVLFRARERLKQKLVLTMNEPLHED